MNRNQTPRAFFASVLIHLMVLFALARWMEKSRPGPEVAPEAPPEPIARVIFPPSDVWRPPAPPTQAPPVPRPDRPARPEPTPEPRREARDRVSIGGPAPERQKTPLELRRDEDLSRRVAQGRPDAALDLPDEPDETTSAPVAEPVDAPRAHPKAPVGPPRPRGAPSIAESLRQLDQRLADGPVGLQSGAGQQMGDLFFDPQGADFTAWTNTFKNEIYRNWIVPPSVTFGARGHVDLEFLVERDGRVSALRIVRSSGTPALDRAAANAVIGGRFLPLPSDFRPVQLAIQVSFFYNARAGS